MQTFSRFFVAADGRYDVVKPKCRCTLAQAKKRYGNQGVVTPVRDELPWAYTEEYDQGKFGVFKKSDKDYYYLLHPVDDYNYIGDLEKLELLSQRGCRRHCRATRNIFSYSDSPVSQCPKDRDTYSWLKENKDYNLAKEYLTGYIQFFGHLNEVPVFWDAAAAQHPYLDENMPLYWASLKHTLAKSDIRTHARIATELFEQDAIVNTEDAVPYLKAGLLLPNDKIRQLAESEECYHERMAALLQLQQILRDTRKLAPFRRTDFQRERKSAERRIRKYIQENAPQHALADTLLYQWEMFENEDMDERGLQGQLQSLCTGLVPTEMWELKGQENLEPSDIHWYLLVPWLRTWYNSLPVAV